MKSCQWCGANQWIQKPNALPDCFICSNCDVPARGELIAEDDDIPLIGLKIDGKQVRSVKDVLLALLLRSESMAETRFERIVIGLIGKSSPLDSDSDIKFARDIVGLAFCIDREMAKKDYEAATCPPRVSV